jgi:tRNA (cmo5U34)-methyltransferase
MADKKVLNMEQNRSGSRVEKPRDQIFAEAKEIVTDFKFDQRTATVFDDMVGRSVPFYDEIQRMIGELTADFAVAGTRVQDLGCATGTTMLVVDKTVDKDVTLIGVDNSAEMLERAEQKFSQHGMTHAYELVNGDLETYSDFHDTSVALMVLTLQFVRPLQRERIVGEICRKLNPGGALILVEKLSFAPTLINRLFIKYYYDMKKRNGYSDVEIAQKREALENVLIPYRMDENVDLLREAGFRHVEEFFRWYNFCGIIALK